MLGLMMDRPLLISDQIEFAATYFPDVEIVSRNTDGTLHRTSWGQVARRARQLAHALVALGIQQGDRVGTIAWNNHRHLELYFAVSSLGAVLHTINPRLSPEQLCFIVGHAEDKALFFDTTFAKLADVVRAQPASPVQHYVALTDGDYDARLAGQPETFAWPQLDERTASSLCYTSGTAGNPKGVLYSHRSTVLHSYAIAMKDALGISASDVTLPVLLRQRLRVLPGLGLVLRWSQEEARRAAQRVVLQMVWPGYPRRLQAFLLEVKQAALMEVLRALWLEALLPEFCRRRTSGRFLQRLSLGRLCLLFPLV